MRHWHRPLMVFSATMVALAVVSAVGLVADPRVLVGAPIWAKPLKFSISLALYCPTLAWMISMVQGERPRRWADRLGIAVTAASAVEMVVIVLQVVRGRSSHFDVATALDATLWGVMGVTIVILFLAVLAFAVVVLRQRSLPADLAWAVRLGTVVSLIGMAVAFLMTSPTGSQIEAAGRTGALPTVGAHTVGPPDGGPGLPLIGWSTVGGDLRIGHFVGLHGMQAVPLLALALIALAPRVRALADVRTRARMVMVGAAGWTGLTLLVTWQALRAQPLVAPDRWTLLALAVLAVAVAAAAVVVLRGSPTPAPTTVATPVEH